MQGSCCRISQTGLEGGLREPCRLLGACMQVFWSGPQALKSAGNGNVSRLPFRLTSYTAACVGSDDRRLGREFSSEKVMRNRQGVKMAYDQNSMITGGESRSELLAPSQRCSWPPVASGKNRCKDPGLFRVWRWQQQSDSALCCDWLHPLPHLKEIHECSAARSPLQDRRTCARF